MPKRKHYGSKTSVRISPPFFRALRYRTPVRRARERERNAACAGHDGAYRGVHAHLCVFCSLKSATLLGFQGGHPLGGGGILKGGGGAFPLEPPEAPFIERICSAVCLGSPKALNMPKPERPGMFRAVLLLRFYGLHESELCHYAAQHFEPLKRDRQNLGQVMEDNAAHFLF